MSFVLVQRCDRAHVAKLAHLTRFTRKSNLELVHTFCWCCFCSHGLVQLGWAWIADILCFPMLAGPHGWLLCKFSVGFLQLAAVRCWIRCLESVSYKCCNVLCNFTGLQNLWNDSMNFIALCRPILPSSSCHGAQPKSSLRDMLVIFIWDASEKGRRHLLKPVWLGSQALCFKKSENLLPSNSLWKDLWQVVYQATKFWTGQD